MFYLSIAYLHTSTNPAKQQKVQNQYAISKSLETTYDIQSI